MKTVLILVLSCKSDPFPSLMLGQMATWNTLDWPGVSTLFYVGNSGETNLDENILNLPVPDDGHHMGWKCRLAFDYASKLKWDYIFRTNASSYVCKRRLIEFAQQLPNSKCYCGPSAKFDLPFSFVGGAGMFLSRDVVNLLRSKIECRTNSKVAEDVEIGEICHNHNIQITPGSRRIDFYFGADRNADEYHYRCKPEKRIDSNPQDLVAFDYIFQRKKRLYV